VESLLKKSEAAIKAQKRVKEQQANDAKRAKVDSSGFLSLQGTSSQGKLRKKSAGSAAREHASDGLSEDSLDNGSSEEDEELSVSLGHARDETAGARSSTPGIYKEDSALRKKLAAAQAGCGPAEPAVMYVGRIPHGFFEKEMRGYFGQFGTVTRLRLSRNKRTGQSKHYAFVEFENEEVAKIVVETMNNYLLEGRLLQCSLVPKEKIHPALFVNANKRYLPANVHDRAREKHNRPKAAQEEQAQKQKLAQLLNTKQARIKELGIDFEVAIPV